MEHVAGETLKDRLARSPLSLSEFLQQATEIAEALEIAHDQPSDDSHGQGETPSPARWQRPIPLAVLGLLIVLLDRFLWRPVHDSQPTQPTANRWSVVPPEGASLVPHYITLSPDGRRLVYPADRGDTSQLYVRDLFGSGWESRAIPQTEGACVRFSLPTEIGWASLMLMTTC